MSDPGQAMFVSYTVEPDSTLPKNTFRFSVTTPAGDPRLFTCEVFNEAGDDVCDMVTQGGTTDSSPNDFTSFAGHSLTLRLNYKDSGRESVGIPLAFTQDLSAALDQQRIRISWSAQTVAVSEPPRPLVQLDPAGSPVVLSYDIPEPTSYRGRQIIEMDFPVEWFASQANVAPQSTVPTSSAPRGGDQKKQSAVRANVALPSLPRLSPVSSPSPIYADDAPVLGTTVPPERTTDTTKLTDQAIATAYEQGKATGYFDPKIFPGIRVGDDAASLLALGEALAGLDTRTVVTQIQAGRRLALYRDTSGRLSYRFIAEPLRGAPSLLLVEYYRLSSFPARYGAGRTIKTFSLLPGEKTRIRVNTYKRSSQSVAQSSSILDSTSQDTESEFERSVLAEQSSQDASSRSLEYHAEAQAEGKASWGWGSASVQASGGVKGASNATREEFAKNLTNAVAQNAARASSRRDVEIDTSLDTKLEAGEEEAVERDLENINVSRTLNFVFRQMNQEFVSVLHLVDVRVAYFNGYGESRMEVPLPQLEDLLNTYIVRERHDAVHDAITAELQAITDYRGQTRTDFVQPRTLTGDDQQSITYLRVNPDAVSVYRPGPDAAPINVPGVIMAAESHVMRTDGVVVDTFLGLGNALDDYSTGLQTETVRAEQIENGRRQAELDRLQLAMQLIRDKNTDAVKLYQQIFPTNPIINQIEQAAIGTPNGQTQPTTRT
jgi:hypothetical protein